MVSSPTRPNGGFESKFQSVSLLEWARCSRLNRLSVRNSLKGKIGEVTTDLAYF